MIAYSQQLEQYGNYLDAGRAEEAANLLPSLAEFWKEQANGDAHRIEKAKAQTLAFYTGYAALYDTVDQTTGDTPKQLGDFQAFAEEHAATLLGADILDIGCGDGKRITNEMGRILTESSIVGVDHRLPEPVSSPNVSFKVGDFSNLPTPDSSIGLATAHWSVVNDLLVRSQQREAFSELRRVLKPGGLFYFDVPTLEGDHGYEQAAKEHHADNPDDLYGTIEREFPGDRKKQFYIYPQAEIYAMLSYFGMGVLSREDWDTRAGQTRTTISARLER